MGEFVKVERINCVLTHIRKREEGPPVIAAKLTEADFVSPGLSESVEPDFSLCATRVRISRSDNLGCKEQANDP